MITGVPESLPKCQSSLLLTPQQPSFLPQAALLSATPASHQLHTSHSGVGIQTLVRLEIEEVKISRNGIQTLVQVGVNESKEGARGGGRIRHTSRISRQIHLNSPTITKNASKYKAIQANSPKMAAWFQKADMGHTLHLNISWISFLLLPRVCLP